MAKLVVNDGYALMREINYRILGLLIIKIKLRADALKSATCILVPVQNNASTVKNIVAAQQIDTSETATRRPADL